MEKLTLENLERFNAQNGGPPDGDGHGYGDPPGDGDSNNNGGGRGGGPGRSSAGNDVASIYTHSVIDDEYEGFELFTKLFLDPNYGLSQTFGQYQIRDAPALTYIDNFKLFEGNWEEDRYDDGGVGYKKMNPYGWFFQRFRTKGNFECGNEQCAKKQNKKSLWHTEQATVEVQFKSKASNDEAWQITTENKRKKGDSGIYFNYVRIFVLVYSQQCKMCKQVGSFHFKNNREIDKIQRKIVEKILQVYDLPFVSQQPQKNTMAPYEKHRESHLSELCLACSEGVCVVNFNRDIFQEVKEIHSIFETQLKIGVLKPCDEDHQALLYGLRMYAQKGPCTNERPPSGERDKRQWEQWKKIRGETKERAAEMYISSARTFINWGRAKFRVRKNYTNNRKNYRKN